MSKNQTNEADLDRARSHWQQSLEAMCRGGIEPANATDTMMQVAVAARVSAEGLRRVSHELFMLAHALHAQAEASEKAAKH